MRFLKQFLYGLFYLAVLFVLGFGFYRIFAKPAPSCFNGIKDQNEEGIDCGGPCALVCAPPNGVTLLGNVQVLAVDGSNSSLLAYIQNPNADKGASVFGYTFTVYKSDGTNLGSFSGSSFIYPAEAKYLVVPKLNIPKSAVDHVALSFDGVTWATAARMVGQPKLTFQGVVTSVTSDGLVVNGKLVNNDTTPFPSVLIVAVFKNLNGYVVGVSQTELNDVGLNASRSFSIVHPFLPGIYLSGTIVQAYATRP